MTPRRRGRPKGATTRLLQDDAGALGPHHFAFLRAWFQRLDLRDAWQRYLAFSEPGRDTRGIERRRAQLLGRVLHAGRQIDLSLSASQRVTRQLDLLAQPPRAIAAASLPTLDEFIAAQGLDREFYSEAELLQEYRQHYHLDTPPDGAGDLTSTHSTHTEDGGHRDQIRALNQLERLLARSPGPGDRLALWLAMPLARRLADAGITTLAGLAGVLAKGDANWHRHVPGLGRTAAHRLAQWLGPMVAAWAPALPTEALLATPAQRALSAAARRSAPPVGAGIPVPMERLRPPSPTAQRDLQAVQAWLSRFEAGSATRRAYGKEAERFVLWCLLLRRRPLTDMSAEDLIAYHAFLAAPPASWIQPLRVARQDPAWRPFRAALGESSRRYALGVVRNLLQELQAAGHRVSPTLVVTQPPVAVPLLARQFSAEEWRFLQTCLDAETAACAGRSNLQAAAQVRRIRLILALLSKTGWRLSQIAQARLVRPAAGQGGWSGGGGGGAILRCEPEQRDGRAALEFVADGGLLTLLQAHHADVERVASLPDPVPLVCSLGEQPRQWQVLSPGSAQAEVMLDSRSTPNGDALGTTGMALALKRFFKRAADQAERDAGAALAGREEDGGGLDAQRLRSASAQWARGVGRRI